MSKSKIARNGRIVHYLRSSTPGVLPKGDGPFSDEERHGMSADRAELQRLLKQLHQGDVVMVEDLTRLSRSFPQLKRLLRLINRSGARVVIEGASDRNPGDSNAN